MRRMARNGRSRSRVRCTLVALVLVLGCGGENTPTDPGDGPDPTPTNQPPSAAAGVDATVSAGFGVTVDGSGSTDPDGDALTYAWTLTTPSGSTAALDDPSTVMPSFVPDVEGDYVVSLTVNDGTVDSASDDVVLTALDRTVAAAIDATGGEVSSTDGGFTLAVPSGALSEETEIRITELSGSQVPEGVADLPYPNMTVYQLEPSGLTFTTPAVVEVVVPDAISVIDGVLTVETGLLLSESDGVVEPMGNLRLEPSSTDPDAMVLTGELEHFSHGIFSEWRRNGVYFTANPPEQVDDGERFEVSVRIQDEADYGEVSFATLVDGSASPVAVDPAGGGVAEVRFRRDDSGPLQAVVEYLCDGSGLGDWIVDVRVEVLLDPQFPVFFDVFLANPVICRRGVSVTERPSVWADRLSPGSGNNDVLVAGWEPHSWDLSTGDVTDLGDVGAQFNHLHPVQDGLYGNTVLGRDWVRDSERSWEEIWDITPDQGRQFVQGPDGDVYGANAYGEAKRVGEDPDVGGFRTWEYALDQLEAFWADGERGVAVRTTGDGNSAFNASVAMLVTLGAALSTTTLGGDALDEILDQYQRLVKDLQCSPSVLIPALLVCMFTAAERTGAALEDQVERHGLAESFIVDTEAETATTVERSGVPGVGAAAFQYEGRNIVAWANQLAGSAEFREVTADGEVGLSLSLPVGQWCARIIDFAVTRSGEFAAMSCGGDEEQGLETKYVSLSIPWAF